MYQNHSLMAFVASDPTAEIIRVAARQRHIKADVHVGGVDTALEHLNDTGIIPEFLVLDLSASADLDGELERFSEMAPESDASVVVIGGCDDARTYRRMRWMGVSEYIATPVDQEEISGILAELAREKLANGRVIDANRHVCVYGVRGGAGASSIAATLATAMAEDHRARTLLLDLDIRHGTQYLLFGFDPAEGLIDMFETPARIDPLIMNRAMERVSQNLSVLSSHSGEPDGAIHADSPRTLVTNGQRGFEYVITDVPARNDECRDMILTAGTLFLVTDATIPGLRDTLTTLGYLDRKSVV